MLNYNNSNFNFTNDVPIHINFKGTIQIKFQVENLDQFNKFNEVIFKTYVHNEVSISQNNLSVTYVINNVNWDQTSNFIKLIENNSKPGYYIPEPEVNVPEEINYNDILMESVVPDMINKSKKNNTDWGDMDTTVHLYERLKN